MKKNAKKLLSVLIVFLLALNVVYVGNFAARAKAENTKHFYQINTIGVMPDDYIGSITLNAANTVEDDYVSDWSFPMQGMSTDANGDIIVTDPEYGRIHVLDKNLQNKLTFGELGKGPGRLQYPADVTTDKDGNFYVADFFNNYWAKFDKTGKWLLNVGTEGTDDGQFNGPSGIAIGPDGNVYVSDQLNSRIEVFTKDGKFVKEISNSLTSYPGALVFDNEGNLLIVSMKLDKILKIAPDGSIVTSFGGKGTTNGKFIDPFDIAVDKDNNIYVVDRGIGKSRPSVQKFDKDGNFIARIGHRATKIPFPNGSFLTPSGITVDKDGNIYIFDAGYFYNSGGGPKGGPNPFGYPIGVRLTVFDSQGNYTSKKDFDVKAPGRLVGSWSAAVDSQGKIWVTSWNNFSDTGEADIFTKDGKFMKSITKAGSDNFSAIGGIIADGKGNVYIGLANFIAQFDENGNFVKKIGAGKVSSVDQMAFDPDGNLWCASYGTQTVVGFAPDGTFIKQFRLAKAATGLAIDKDGNFYCLANDEGKVYVYTKDGKRGKSFGGTGRKEGVFWYPQGLAIGKNGEILIADTENGRIQAYSKDGKFLWSTDREYYEPMMMNWGPDGNLYLADGFHSVVRVLSTKPPKVSDYNFTVKPSLSVLEIKAGEKGSFNFIIKNTGKADDTYDLALDASELPSGWKVSEVPDKVSVKAGDQTLIQITVTTTPDSPPKEKGTLTLNVVSENDSSLKKSASVIVQIPERPPVNFTFEGDKIPLNEEGSITVNVEKTEGVYGIALTIAYDPDMLKVDKVEPTGALGSDALFLEDHSKQGSIIIGYTLKGKSDGVTVVGPVVKITFTGLKVGKTSVQFAEVSMIDTKGEPIKTQQTDGDIVVYDTTPPKITVDFQDGTEVTDPNFYFSGKTEPGCKVTINGNSVNVDTNDGTFIGSVYLDQGENTITIISTNKYGVSNTLVMHVILKTSTVITLQPNNPYMTVNGVKQEIDPGRGTKPVIIAKWGRTVVPIRAIVEALGGTITWDGTERKVTIEFNETTIELWIGKPQARVNGEMKWIDSNNHDVKPIIVNGRTMLPLRFVAENLGCKVDWDPTTKTITITYPAP